MVKIFEKWLLKNKIFIVFVSVMIVTGCGKEEKKSVETEAQKANAVHVELKPESIKPAEPIPLKPVIAEPSALQ